jgi:anti-sigma B factor antagonist
MNKTLVIEGEMTVFTAHDIKARLLEAIPPKGDLTVVLEDVAEFDGAGLQLLVAAQHEATSRGGALHLQSPSNSIHTALRLAGLEAHFDVIESQIQEVHA